MEFKFHIPTQQYGFLEVSESDKEIDRTKLLTDLENIYNRYAEFPLKFTEGVYEELRTFTGETILYDAAKHKYKTLNGLPLVSGSQYKKLFDKPFDVKIISKAVAKKYPGVDARLVADMWKSNGNISTTFGRSLHLAMEHYFKFRALKTKYHMPSNPFLNIAVSSFPLLDANIMPEVLLSDVKNGMVGVADGLLHSSTLNSFHIIDYKSDGDISKNLEGHFKQLNFYAHILINKGFAVDGLDVWNYVSSWEKHNSPVFSLDTAKIGLALSK